MVEIEEINNHDVADEALEEEITPPKQNENSNECSDDYKTQGQQCDNKRTNIKMQLLALSGAIVISMATVSCGITGYEYFKKKSKK